MTTEEILAIYQQYGIDAADANRQVIAGDPPASGAQSESSASRFSLARPKTDSAVVWKLHPDNSMEPVKVSHRHHRPRLHGSIAVVLKGQDSRKETKSSSGPSTPKRLRPQSAANVFKRPMSSTQPTRSPPGILRRRRRHSRRRRSQILRPRRNPRPRAARRKRGNPARRIRRHHGRERQRQVHLHEHARLPRPPKLRNDTSSKAPTSRSTTRKRSR